VGQVVNQVVNLRRGPKGAPNPPSGVNREHPGPPKDPSCTDRYRDSEPAAACTHRGKAGRRIRKRTLEWPDQSSYDSFVKRASITDAKNRLSQLIDGLKGGSPVLIVDRGRPVARLEPVTGGSGRDSDGRLARLVREGIVRPGRASLPADFFTAPPPRPKPGASALRALLAERREGR
jgi:prevent-host-death family protein